MAKTPRRTKARPSTDEVVDEGVKETFPASDPVAVPARANTEHERRQRGEPDPVPPPRPQRSPDWLFEKK